MNNIVYEVVAKCIGLFVCMILINLGIYLTSHKQLIILPGILIITGFTLALLIQNTLQKPKISKE